jgi:hypothetical protein
MLRSRVVPPFCFLRAASGCESGDKTCGAKRKHEWFHKVIPQNTGIAPVIGFSDGAAPPGMHKTVLYESTKCPEYLQSAAYGILLRIKAKAGMPPYPGYKR